MPLVPFRFNPGVNREVTALANEGGWVDCDKIRFRFGYPETIGGWQRTSQNETFLGTCRGMYVWADLSNNSYVGLGTNLKYYILTAATLYDITPIRETTAAGDVTFSATNGSAELTVTDTAHGAVLNDFVTFSGAVSLGGQITADVLNQEYQITSIVDDDNYTINAKDTDGNQVTADGSDTGNGGASVVGEYQINTGGQNTVVGSGWGTDPWGAGGWGAASSSSAEVTQLRTWTHDNFGEDLIINPRSGGIYYWDTSSGTSSNRAVALSDLAGAQKAPTVAECVLVSDQDRHVIAFGCDDEFNIGTQDKLLIRFSDQENAAEWRTLTTNTAGSLRVSSGSKIVRAIQTKREILVMTDASLHSMQFLGPPFTFGLQEIAPNSGIAGPNAVVNANDVVYWMAQGRFMVYDGRVRELPCSVKEYVFGNMNLGQMEKVYAGHLPDYQEIWWFYPTTGNENDSYVIYNYEQQVWYYGTIVRTAWVENGLLTYPLATDASGYVYEHENGFDDNDSEPAVALNAYIESGVQDIGDGEQYMFASRIIPDLSFRNSTNLSGSVTLKMEAREFPGSAYGQSYTTTVTYDGSGDDNFTDQVYIRLRGRSMKFRIESNESGLQWRLGVPRVEVRPDGRK